MKLAVLIVFVALLGCSMAAIVGRQSFRVNFSYTTSGLGTGSRIVGQIFYKWTGDGNAGSWMRAEYRDMNVGTNGQVFLTEIFDYEEERRFSFGNDLDSCPCETVKWTANMPRFFVDDTLYTNTGTTQAFGPYGGAGEQGTGAAVTCARWTANSASNEVEELWMSTPSDSTSRPCRAIFRNGAGTWNFDLGNGPYTNMASTNTFGTNSDSYNTNPQQSSKFTPWFNGDDTTNCPEPICNAAVDLVFVFDESGSIDTNEFANLRQFATGLIDRFEFGPGAVYGASVYYSGYNNPNSNNQRRTGCRDRCVSQNQRSCTNSNSDCCQVWSRTEDGSSNTGLAVGADQNCNGNSLSGIGDQTSPPFGFGLYYNGLREQSPWEPSDGANAYPGMTASKSDLRSEIEDHIPGAGFTCTTCGVREGLETFKFFDATATGQLRRDKSVPQVMVVLTDGASNRERVTFRRELQAVFNYGIEVFAIGVTDGVRTCELRRLVGCPATNENDEFGGDCGLFRCDGCEFDLDFVGPNSDRKCSERILISDSFDDEDLAVVADGLASSLCQPLPSTGGECLECESLCACGSTCQCPSSCDDGLFCTLDKCAASTDQDPGTEGECIHDPVSASLCDDDNECTTEVCQEADADTGAGQTQALIEVPGIVHGRPSTQTIKCVYSPVDCGSNDRCLVDSCSEDSGCSSTARNCDDGKFCTVDSCESTGAVTFPATGCNHVPACPETDTTLCTQRSCDETRSQAQGRRVCVLTTTNCDDNDPCTTDSCDPDTGNCTNTRFYNDGECANCVQQGTVCTERACETVTCDDGVNHDQTPVCVYENITDFQCCDPNTADNQKVCDDGNACTQNLCDPEVEGGCVFPAINPDTINCCNTTTGNQFNCDDGNACTNDFCNTTTGTCEHIQEDDCCGDPCGIDTNPDPCLVITCAAGGLCSNYTIACCDAAQPDNKRSCGDGNPCTDDFCNPSLTEDDDESPFFNKPGRCVNTPRFRCCDPTTGNARMCTQDRLPCETNVCSEASDIQSEWNGGTCNYVERQNAAGSGPFCTFCRPDGVTPRNCTPADTCLTGVCDPATSACVESDVCTPDGDPCTIDSCEDGTCITTPACIPSDTDGCNIITCQAGSGEGDYECITTDNSLTLCNDNNLCTDDSCSPTGAFTFDCTNTFRCPNVDDGNPCTDDFCDRNTGQCVNVAKPASFCNDGNPCTVDKCDPQSTLAPPNGPCTHTPWNFAEVEGGNPTLCDDGDFCTTDGCNSRANVTGTYNPLGDSSACTAETVICLPFDECSVPACAPQEVRRSLVWCGNGVTCCNTDPESCPSDGAPQFDCVADGITIDPNNITESTVARCHTVSGCFSVPVLTRLDACLVCGGDGISCFLDELEGSDSGATVIGVAAGLGITAAAIAVAAVLFCGGRKGYQYFSNQTSDQLTTATESPLFTNDGLAGEVEME